MLPRCRCRRELAGMLALLPLCLAAGCEERPSALPLDDGPVYNDTREGFRFFPPPAWKQVARGIVPHGKIAAERMLTEYQQISGTKPATLQVSVADVPLNVSLADYVKNEMYRAEEWRPAGDAESFQINGVPAARLSYRKPSGKDAQIREVVAFRRGERVYFFTSFYLVSDAKSRKAIQGAIDSIVW